MSEPVIVETRFERHPEAALIRFNRPAKKNSLPAKDFAVLGDRLSALSHDTTVKVIIITGTGEAFTSGQDVNDINSLQGAELAALFERDIDLLSRVISMPKIVITAVNGATSGFGNHLAICSDLCVVKKGAKFHFTGAAKALPSLLLGTLLLPMTVGLKRAKSIYLRGGEYSAEQAVADGFANAVIDDADWDSEVEKLAAEFSARNPLTMAHNKYQLNQGALQMLGAVKLSGLAGAGLLTNATSIPTGRVDYAVKKS
ncbi:MAG: enoyl-CoA hydratase/isomerase family protein [Pseudolabrys sp.]